MQILSKSSYYSPFSLPTVFELTSFPWIGYLQVILQPLFLSNSDDRKNQDNVRKHRECDYEQFVLHIDCDGLGFLILRIIDCVK